MHKENKQKSHRLLYRLQFATSKMAGFVQRAINPHIVPDHGLRDREPNKKSLRYNIVPYLSKSNVRLSVPFADMDQGLAYNPINE